jgi:hypothetical protein
MSKIFNFYGKEIFNPGAYSKILAVGGAEPTPSGENALIIIAEGTNGVKFGELIAVATVNDAKAILGDQGPAIEAVFKAYNPSPTLSPAQDVRVFNPRALVQADNTIYTTAPSTGPAIDVASRIYGPVGNGVNISLASTVLTVKFPWSDDDFVVTVDNPIMDIIMPSGFVTIDSTKISVGLTGNLTEFVFTDYPKLVDLINAIETQEPTASITKDANVSDNQSTIDLFDHIVSETAISTLYTIKADLKQLFDYLDKSLPDIEATKLATATVMVDDFDLNLEGGTSGVDPDAVQWGKVYDELQNFTLAVTCPINDGLATPYDETLSKAIMSLDEQHAVQMNQPDKRGKRRQSFISAHGGYGWSGQYLAPPVDADAVATLGNLHNSEYSQFFADGLTAINEQGNEYAQIPCYFAVQCASMFLGSLASRVITSQVVTATKATVLYSESDTKKIHRASVVIPITENGITYIRQFYSTWKETNEPMKTVPSRTRCAMLSASDIERKLESWIKGYQRDGNSPYTSEGVTFIKRVLQSQANKSINWVVSWGAVTFSISGIEFKYEVKDLIVPAIPEYGFGTVEVLNV